MQGWLQVAGTVRLNHPGLKFLACPSGQCLATLLLGPCCLPLGTGLPWLPWA